MMMNFGTMAEMEIAELEPEVARLEAELRNLLLPKDPRDNRDVIMEVRAGTGGDEAAIFAADLYPDVHPYTQNARTGNMKSSHKTRSVSADIKRSSSRSKAKVHIPN